MNAEFESQVICPAIKNFFFFFFFWLSVLRKLTKLLEKGTFQFYISSISTDRVSAAQQTKFISITLCYC